MGDSRNNRNFGNGKTLNRFTIRNLARETAKFANRGDGLALKAQSALSDLSQHLRDIGVRYLEILENGHLESWAEELRERLVDGDLSSSTTSSYVSAVNTVFATHDREDLKLSAKDFGLNRGMKFSNRNLSNSQDSHRAFKAYCNQKYQQTGDIRFIALHHSVSIQRQAGLRFRESTQIKIAIKDLSGLNIHLVKGDGVKNGQNRLFTPTKMTALREAQEFVKNHSDQFQKGSLIPSEISYRSYKAWAYKRLEKFRAANPEYDYYRFHGNRHNFAHRQYEKEWILRIGKGIKAPVITGSFGKVHLKEICEKTGLTMQLASTAFKDISLKIAEKLGHHRVESGYSYLGK